MCEPGFVAEQPMDLLANRIELLDSQATNRSAALAGEVFALAVTDERVEAGAVSEVDVPGEPVLLERFEVPVDGGEVESQLGRDVFCRSGPVG